MTLVVRREKSAGGAACFIVLEDAGDVERRGPAPNPLAELMLACGVNDISATGRSWLKPGCCDVGDSSARPGYESAG